MHFVMALWAIYNSHSLTTLFLSHNPLMLVNQLMTPSVFVWHCVCLFGISSRPFTFLIVFGRLSGGLATPTHVLPFRPLFYRSRLLSVHSIPAAFRSVLAAFAIHFSIQPVPVGCISIPVGSFLSVLVRLPRSDLIV